MGAASVTHKSLSLSCCIPAWTSGYTPGTVDFTPQATGLTGTLSLDFCYSATRTVSNLYRSVVRPAADTRKSSSIFPSLTYRRASLVIA
ncbi:hypothetical protein RRG08_020690 [Elysia crispata]|uniref:Uncharacterized protein n=1 Tax=Elysia crispata TaxID=231223 RepID=A0AAE0Z633_9GAST|nr:hypothetical protein RRG08_020690 [Elysia crispata]